MRVSLRRRDEREWRENIAGFIPVRLPSKQSVKTYFSDFAVINDRPLVLKEL